MKAIIMAGGMASRYGGQEKALLSLQNRTLLERAIDILRKSDCDDIVVAISPNTPKTEDFCKKRRIATIMTPGKGYHDDIYYLLSRYDVFLSLNVDVALIESEDVRRLLENVSDTSLACVVAKEEVAISVDKESVFRDENGKYYVWVGLNYVSPSNETEILLMSNWRLALNINTAEDLKLAEKILVEDAG